MFSAFSYQVIKLKRTHARWGKDDWIEKKVQIAMSSAPKSLVLREAYLSLPRGPSNRGRDWGEPTACSPLDRVPVFLPPPLA